MRDGVAGEMRRILNLLRASRHLFSDNGERTIGRHHAGVSLAWIAQCAEIMFA